MKKEDEGGMRSDLMVLTTPSRMETQVNNDKNWKQRSCRSLPCFPFCILRRDNLARQTTTNRIKWQHGVRRPRKVLWWKASNFLGFCAAGSCVHVFLHSQQGMWKVDSWQWEAIGVSLRRPQSRCCRAHRLSQGSEGRRGRDVKTCNAVEKWKESKWAKEGDRLWQNKILV